MRYSLTLIFLFFSLNSQAPAQIEKKLTSINKKTVHANHKDTVQLRLDIYAGYTHVTDKNSYNYAIRTLISQMEERWKAFSSVHVRLIRFGDRNTVTSVPVYNFFITPDSPCKTSGSILKKNQTIYQERCKNEKKQRMITLKQNFKNLKSELMKSPDKRECVSFRNLIGRLRSESNISASIILTDGANTCRESYEPLKRESITARSLFVIQIATGREYEAYTQFLRQALQPSSIIPGTSADETVRLVEEHLKKTQASIIH